MIKGLGFTILICTSFNALHAKDYGVQGNLFKIHETSLLEHILSKLRQAQADGTLEKKMNAMAQKLKKRAGIPDPVEGITITQEERISFYDPSITVQEDIKDHRGVIFQKKGKKLNPLENFYWGDPLVFLDGNEPLHQQYARQSKGEKIVLVNGKPLEMSETFGKPIYFDQMGKLVEKFGIKHVPCRVSQDGKRLKVHEFTFKEKR